MDNDKTNEERKGPAIGPNGPHRPPEPDEYAYGGPHRPPEPEPCPPPEEKQDTRRKRNVAAGSN